MFIEPQQRRWYQISKTEFWIALVPPAVALVLKIVFYRDSSDLAVFASVAVVLLTLPGFMLSEMLVLALQDSLPTWLLRPLASVVGSAHDPTQNWVCIPLSAAFMLLLVRGVRRVRSR